MTIKYPAEGPFVISEIMWNTQVTNKYIGYRRINGIRLLEKLIDSWPAVVSIAPRIGIDVLVEHTVSNASRWEWSYLLLLYSL